MIILIEEASVRLVSFCNEKAKKNNVIIIPDGINHIQLENFLQENGIEKKDCIWVVADKAQAQEAQMADIASIGEVQCGTKYAVESIGDIDGDYLEKVWMRFNGIPWTIGYTKRCMIRELCLEDIDALYKLYEKPEVTEFIEPLYELEKEIAYQKDYIKYVYGYYEYGMWLIFDKNNGLLIGRAGLDHREYDGKSELEMGYILDPEYQGQGYATEICKFIIEYAWKNTESDSISCFIAPQNIKSTRLASRLGFKKQNKIDTGNSIMERWVLFRKMSDSYPDF